jgi:hypothetical protein
MRLRWEGDAPTPHTPPGFAIRRLNFCWFKATPALAQKNHQFFRDAERKWRTVGYFDIQEFKIILSRQIDRFFVERNLPFTCGIQFDVFGGTREFVQRNPTHTFDATMDYIRNILNIYNNRPYSEIIINHVDYNYTLLTDIDYLGMDIRPIYKQEKRRIVCSLQLINVLGTEDEKREYLHHIDTFLPTVHEAILRVLYLKFDTVSKTILYPLALTTRFEDKRGSILDRPTRNRKKASDANIHNETLRQNAITALAIVAANQAGERYFSGVGDPRQLLIRSRQKDFEQSRK